MDINKKIFGSNVEAYIIGYFNDMQRGTFEINPGEQASYNSHMPTYHGDRTPFARMWVAVNVREEISGEEEGPSLPGGGRNYGKTYVYTINDNRNKSYERNEMDSINQKKGVSYKPELTDNPYLKPASGITSINSKSEGAVGALRRTTVDFVVHNREDFNSIFLPFFLKPGATVFVDFGWADKAFNLYNPETIIKNKNPKMTDFHREIFSGRHYIEDGFRTTLTGQVTKYDVNVDQNGSFNCTLEFVSSNYALLDKSINDDNSLKFIFENLIEELILKYYITFVGGTIDNDLSLEQTNKISPADRKKLAKDFFDTNKNQGDGNVGFIDPLSLKSGVFYQNISGGESEESVLDDKEALYISYGLFEDRFLNNFISYWITTDDDGNEEKKDTGPYSNGFSSANSYVRYDADLVTVQGMNYRNSDERMSFLYPENWDREKTYNKLKPRFFNDAKDDTEKKRIPLRELFIAVPIISEAFKASTNVNDALEFIFDKIYADSGNIINIKMIPNNDAQTSITFQDINVEAGKFDTDDELPLKFDLTSGNAIVLNSDLKFETPKAGLSSMIAIGNMDNDNIFDEMELMKFNFLNALSGEDKKIRVQHLPIYGKTPSVRKSLDIDMKRFMMNVDAFPQPGARDRKIDLTKFVNDRLDAIDAYYAKTDSDSSDTDEPDPVTYTRREKNKLGQVILYASSEREVSFLNAKINNFIKTDNHSISPVMPISLTLKVYGNNFLGIGDFFTVNFLPKHYEERVYFQIVGVDHNMGTSMWDTTYTTVMRLKSTVKYKQFGNNDDVKLPIIKYDKKFIKIKAKEIADGTSSDSGISNAAEEILINDLVGKYFAYYTTNKEKVIPNGMSENDLPLLNSGEQIYSYNSDLDSEANKDFKEIVQKVADARAPVSNRHGYDSTIPKGPVASLNKISYSAANPTALTIGSLSYWIIMSNLLLGDDVINWKKVQEDGLKPIIDPNKQMNLNTTPAGSISVITSLPIENPLYQDIVLLPFDQDGPVYGLDDVQTALNNSIQLHGKKQIISTHIDNSRLTDEPEGGFLFFKSVVWPITPKEDNFIIVIDIKPLKHPDLQILRHIKVPTKYLKLRGQVLLERIRKDYCIEKNKGIDLEDFFNKNKNFNPGFPFVPPYYQPQTPQNEPTPHGTSTNPAEARARLANKYEEKSYSDYLKKFPDQNIRREHWLASSELW